MSFPRTSISLPEALDYLLEPAWVESPVDNINKIIYLSS